MSLLYKSRQPLFCHVVALHSSFTASLVSHHRPRVNTNSLRSHSNSLDKSTTGTSSTSTLDDGDEGKPRQQGLLLQRAHLIDILMRKHNISKTQATQILKTVFDTIVEVCVWIESWQGSRREVHHQRDSFGIRNIYTDDCICIPKYSPSHDVCYKSFSPPPECKTVAEKNNVRISDFGSFTSTQSEPRLGRNPLTGEAITIPSSNRIRFKPFKAFKEIVNTDPKEKGM